MTTAKTFYHRRARQAIPWRIAGGVVNVWSKRRARRLTLLNLEEIENAEGGTRTLIIRFVISPLNHTTYTTSTYQRAHHAIRKNNQKTQSGLPAWRTNGERAALTLNKNPPSA